MKAIKSLVHVAGSNVQDAGAKLSAGTEKQPATRAALRQAEQTAFNNLSSVKSGLRKHLPHSQNTCPGDLSLAELQSLGRRSAAPQLMLGKRNIGR